MMLLFKCRHGFQYGRRSGKYRCRREEISMQVTTGGAINSPYTDVQEH